MLLSNALGVTDDVVICDSNVATKLKCPLLRKVEMSHLRCC